MRLNASEREQVARAVRKAEASLSAEIVPCVFEQSSPYPETLWGGAAAAMSLAVAAILLIDELHPLWMPTSSLLLWVPAAGLVGAALGRWCAPIKRLLIGAPRMEAAAARRAKEVFFDHGIGRTAGRDGVLIYASLLEHRVVVLPDEVVRAKAAPGAWDAVVAAMTAHAVKGRVAEGLCAAVDKAAEALRAAGFGGSQSSGNELGDHPIEGDGR
jgi:putative membrane protein